MFGAWYARKDGELVKGGENEQLQYARELLAELLNRSKALAETYWNVYSRRLEVAKDDPGTESDYGEALDRLLHALGIFSHDVDEGLARARRARLVYGAGLFGEVSIGSVDPDLESLGGSLVPWHIDDAVATGNVRITIPPMKRPVARSAKRSGDA